MPVPYIGLTKPFRHAVPPVRIYCSCGIAFERASEREAVRAQAEHAAEMRCSDDHEMEIF